MLERQLMADYETAMRHANDVVFYNNAIEQAINMEVDKKLIDDYAKYMTNAVKKWQKALAKYYRTGKRLQRSIDESGTTIPNRGRNANAEKNSEELCHDKEFASENSI